jgi:hypothetical protein
VNRPTDTIIDAVAPPYDIEGLPISDNRSVRNVAHAELLQTLRLPRSDDHDSTLVALRRHYDGANGGEAGHYALCFVEFRAGGSRWRTAGVKIRSVEAKRIGAALISGKASKPGRSETPRVGGKVIATDESELHGSPVGHGVDGYVVYVRHRMRSGEWGRTMGITVLSSEAPVLARFLGTLTQEQAAKTAVKTARAK